MGTKRSFDLNGLSVELLRIDESNIFSTLATESTLNNGFFIKPSTLVPGRGDISGYVLKSLNENGKVEWTDPSFLPNVSAKQSARVASTVPLDLNNPVFNVDGVALNEGDRVLLKDQVDTNENGIYTVDSSNFLIRSYDAEDGMISTGAYVFITQGVTNATTVWISTEYDSVFGDPITFTQVSGGGGGGTPGGLDTEVQFNNAGVFGGITGVTTSGSNLQFTDNTSLFFGTGNDFQAVFDSSDIIFTNNGPTSSVFYQLGSDSTATNFEIQNDSGLNIFTGYGNQEATIGSNLTVGGTFTSTNAETDITTAANVIYSASEMLNGIILRDPNGAPRSDTTDTAANIVASVHDAVVGSSYEFTVFNTADANESVTLLAGTDVTLDPNGVFVMDENESRTFKVVFTNVTPASEAVTVYSISSNGQGATGGAGGNPFEVQYNNAGVLGGISGVTTNGSTEFDFDDNVVLRFGSAQELQIVYDTTNSIVTSSSGDFVIDNTNTTGSTIFRLGSEEDTTDLQIQNASSGILVQVQGDGFIQQNILTNPIVEGTLVSASLTGIRCVSVQGDYVFFGTSAGLFGCVNVSDPINPTFVSSYNPVSANFDFILARAKYAFLTSLITSTFTIVNISDPSNLFTTGSITDINDLGAAQGFDISGDHAYVGASGRLTSVDISDPSVPTINSSLTSVSFNGQIVNVVVYGTYAYCLSSTNAFNIVNIADPSTMVIVGTLSDAVNLPTNAALSIRGNYVYVGCIDRITVLNVEDKTAPVLESAFVDAALSGVASIKLSGDYLYAISSSLETIVTVDISDPSSLSIVDSLAVGSFTFGFSLSLQGNYLYTQSQNDNSLHVIRLNGSSFTSSEIGNLSVRGDVNVTNNVNIQGYMNCRSGAQFNNALAVMSNMTVHDDFTSKGAFYTKSIHCYNKEVLQPIQIGSNGLHFIDTYNFAGCVECTDIGISEFELTIRNPFCHSHANVFVNSIGYQDDQIKILSIQDQQFTIRITLNSENVTIQYIIIG